jgi:hypothetical protein
MVPRYLFFRSRMDKFPIKLLYYKTEPSHLCGFLNVASSIASFLNIQVLGYKEEEEEGEGRETGTQFTDVDLTELEWAEYDERSGLSTLISGSFPAFMIALLFLPVRLFLRLN